MSNNDDRYLTSVLMGSRVILRSCSNPRGWRRGKMLWPDPQWLFTSSRITPVYSCCGLGLFVLAALAPNSELMLSSAALFQMGLQNAVADTALSIALPGQAEGWALADRCYQLLHSFPLISCFGCIKVEQRGSQQPERVEHSFASLGYLFQTLY